MNHRFSSDVSSSSPSNSVRFHFLFKASHLALVALAICHLPVFAVEKKAFTYEGYDPSEIAADPVDATNWRASARFWPYSVALLESDKSGSETVTPSGLEGVVVYLTSSGQLRLDLGRDGVRTVPLEATDFLVRANEIRRGERTKLAPNFILAYGNRLLDLSSNRIRALRIDDLAESRIFIALLANPHDPRLSEWSEALLELTGAYGGVVAIFYPLPDPAVESTGGLKRLHDSAWPGYVMMQQYVLPYRLSLWDGDLAEPLLMVMSPEKFLFFAKENPAAEDWSYLQDNLGGWMEPAIDAQAGAE